MNQFLSKLDVEQIDGRNWRLTSSLVYQNGEQIIVVPAGFISDFASIPRPLWGIFPESGEYNPAAVIHDFLYRNGGVIDGKQVYSRADADGIFRDAMKVLGVGAFDRNVMYSAVRAFGGSLFKEKN